MRYAWSVLAALIDERGRDVAQFIVRDPDVFEFPPQSEEGEGKILDLHIDTIGCKNVVYGVKDLLALRLLDVGQGEARNNIFDTTNGRSLQRLRSGLRETLDNRESRIENLFSEIVDEGWMALKRNEASIFTEFVQNGVGEDTCPWPQLYHHSLITFWHAGDHAKGEIRAARHDRSDHFSGSQSFGKK